MVLLQRTFVSPLCSNCINSDHWEFKLLLDIRLCGEGPYSHALLLYEDDENACQHWVPCPGHLFPALEPFAQALLAWRRNPLGAPRALIPIAFPDDGAPRFFPDPVDAAEQPA